MNHLRQLIKKEYLLFWITILMGICLRFVNLDQKVYWHDEVYSSLRIMGYSGTEMVQSLFTGEVVDREALQFFQHFNPEKTLQDTLEALGSNPQHPPLYYIMARFWVQFFGDSIGTIRALSALISLFVFPAAYWLCLELFRKPVSGVIMMTLLAISPFHLLFAQEVREYSLWTLTILLASASILRAIRITHDPNSSRSRKYLNWGIYGSILCVGFYTFLFTGLVAFSHLIYSFVVEKFRFSPVIKYHLISVILAIFGFSPWLFVILHNYNHFERTISWTQEFNIPLGNLINSWGLMLSRIWVDLPFNLDQPITDLIKIFSVILFGLAIIFLCRQDSLKIAVFILTLIGVNFLFLAMPDLILGGIRSISIRYLTPAVLGFQLALVNWLTFQLTNHSQKLGRSFLSLIGSIGVISCIFISNSDTAWTKVVSYNLPKIASLINESKEALVISNHSDINPGNILSLSHLLNPEVKYQLYWKSNVNPIDPQFETIFFFNLKDGLREQIEKQNQFQSELIFRDEFINLRKVVK